MSTARRVSVNALFLLMGSVATQVLNLVYVSILARYVGVTGLGKISTAQALMATAFILVNFGFNISLVREIAADLPLARTHVTAVLYVRFLFIVIAAAGVGVVVYFSPYPQDTKIIIALYGLVSVFDAFSNTVRCVFNAHQRMGYRAAIELARQVINIGLSLIGIQLGWSLVQLVVVSVVASGWRTLVSAWVMQTRFVRLDWRLDPAIARHMIVVSIPYFLGFLVSVLNDRFNVVLLSWLADERSVGLFSAAILPILTILFVPDMIMDSVFPVMANAFKHSLEELRTTYEVAYRVMLMLGLPMGAGAMLVSKQVMELVFGDEFLAAAPLMALLSVHLWTISGYVNGYFLGATARQGLFTLIRFVLALLGTGLYLVLIPRFGVWGAAGTFVTVSLLDFVILTVVCLRFTDTTFPWGALAKLGTASAVMYFTGRWMLDRLGLPVLVVVVACVAIYTLLVVAFRGIGEQELAFLKDSRPGRLMARLGARWREMRRARRR